MRGPFANSIFSSMFLAFFLVYILSFFTVSDPRVQRDGSHVLFFDTHSSQYRRLSREEYEYMLS